ncbi:MAG: phosphopentomutase, partial [Candidatus Zixiibacteriota bacterium]
ARPFDGQPGSFIRTSGRRDFSLEPPEKTLLDLLAMAGSKTLAIGKINDLFTGRGVASRVKTANNDEVMQAVMDAVSNDNDHALIFANCVDFDEKWGHRNDEVSFASGLERFDQMLSELLPLLRKDDLLVITADHGCDPTIKSSTDHSREYVPLLVYGRAIRTGVDLGTRETFADLGATLTDWLGVTAPGSGSTFCNLIVPGRNR